MEFLDFILMASDWTGLVIPFGPDLKWPISYELFITDDQHVKLCMVGTLRGGIGKLIHESVLLWVEGSRTFA